MTRTLTKIFPWLLIAPAVLPLVYFDGLLYPYISSKVILFRAIAVIAGAVFAYLAFFGTPFYWRRLRSKISWLPGILLIVALIASAFGADFSHSFWSTMERGDGLLTLLCATVFFYLVLLSADSKFLDRLFKFTAVVGSLVAFHALLQWFEIHLGINFPLVEESLGRLGGTFGNAAFLAAYLGIAVLATLAAARRCAGWSRRLAFVGALLQFLVIFLTATRGTILALAVIGVAAAAYQAFQGTGAARLYSRIALGGICLLVVLFFLLRPQLAKFPAEPVRRLASISFEDLTVSSRLFVWQNMAVESFKRPILGYGGEHIDVVFNKFYDPSKIQEEWFDRSHNSFLDYLVQYGIVGFLLYAGIVLSLGFVGKKLWREGNHWGAYIIMIAAVYAFQNFFVFDTAVTLWFLLVLLAAAFAISDKAHEPAFFRFPYAKVAGGAVSLAIIFLVIPVFWYPLRANRLLAKGYEYHLSDVNKAVDFMGRGLSQKINADLEYGYRAYEMYTGRQVSALQGNDRVVAYRYALELLAKNLERYPYDARTSTYLAHVIELAPSEAVRDEDLFQEAISRAIELSPKRAQPWYMRANISIRKADSAKEVAEKTRSYNEAIATLLEYGNLVPTNSEIYYVIANLHLAMKDRVAADSFAEKGKALFEKHGRNQDGGRAVRYYIKTENWKNAAWFLEDMVTKSPKDYDTAYDLAKISFLAGKRDRAMEIVELLRREKPGLVEKDPAFLAALELN